MFAVNYTTAIAGADFAYVNHGFTAQAEATLLQFVRVRGEDGIGATDSFRTEAAVGLHLGYFIGSHFSLSSDLHYRRWLSHPTTLSAATGARVALSDGAWPARPSPLARVFTSGWASRAGFARDLLRAGLGRARLRRATCSRPRRPACRSTSR